MRKPSVFLFAALTLTVALAQRPPTKCQVEKEKAEKQSEQMVGVFIPQCDPLGWYALQQSWPSTGLTWCVHPDSGRTIPGTSSPPGKPRVDCGGLDVSTPPLSDCEKERASVSDELAHFRPQCDSHGWFSEKQCLKTTGRCWCVDRTTGHEIAGTHTPDESTLNCAKPLDVPLNNLTVPSKAKCADGWYKHGSRCFSIITTPYTWSQAEFQCNIREAHLASVHSHAENQFIVSVVQAQTSSPVWLGGQDITERLWRWSDGSTMDFTNWAPGQPNGGTSENCMVVNDLQWWDNPCGVQRMSVCSKDATT